MRHSRRADRPIRVLLAKPGLDGHDRGVKVLALGLRDAGFEVLYTGLHRTCEEIVNTALQEDVDVIGVSVLSGGQYAALSRIVELMNEQDASDVVIVAGGFMPDPDEVVAIKKLGVRGVFDTDTRIEDVVTFLRDTVAQVRSSSSAA